ncbi:hypothetical protein [Dyadobacter pollutisoli]|jgi:hypothetical protein|uniref:Uncharacterized protein n=1 Tax=Dyadobacter pollutisoli TaxID=2910158 RepID=A0A9E8SNN0_9BACT|nr:hypothetical protein [Dyadobacter pollutisoli]WAC10937.1 hypothetical protein ON006_24720 [Dyadobacter pollutisoli]
MKQSAEIFDIVDHDEWEATPENEKFFSSDHVIDAYMKGRKDGVKDERALIIDKIKSNVTSSSAVTHAAFNEIRRLGFSPISAYLKISDWAIYNILITIPESEFLDDRILEVYSVLSKIEDNFKNDYYSVHISLCDIGDDFSEKCVTIDGYGLRLKHAQEK